MLKEKSDYIRDLIRDLGINQSIDPALAWQRWGRIEIRFHLIEMIRIPEDFRDAKTYRYNYGAVSALLRSADEQKQMISSYRDEDQDLTARGCYGHIDNMWLRGFHRISEICDEMR